MGKKKLFSSMNSTPVSVYRPRLCRPRHTGSVPPSDTSGYASPARRDRCRGRERSLASGPRGFGKWIPPLKKWRACAAHKRGPTSLQGMAAPPCRGDDLQSQKSPNGAPQGAILTLSYEAACSAPSDFLRQDAEGETEVHATGRHRPREGDGVPRNRRNCAPLPIAQTRPAALPARLTAKNSRKPAATRPTSAG